MSQPRRVNQLAIGLCSLGVCTVLALGLPSMLQGRRSANGQAIGQLLEPTQRFSKGGAARSRGLTPANSTVAHPTVTNLPPVALGRDPWAAAVERATRAAALAQTAQGPADWDAVAQAWLGAIAQLQQFEVNDPRRFFAQKKLNEYLRHFLYAQQQALRSTPVLVYPSFGSQRLDEQLTLYLSYVATLGPADILIVGSSRALQGIDPNTLQQGLAAQGMPEIKVFNLGINGATAQVVDVLLRQILPPETLPRLILWADGVRAFNSGRRDRTYEALVKSPGYQRALTGDLPRLQPEQEAIQGTVYEPMGVDGISLANKPCGVGNLPASQPAGTGVKGSSRLEDKLVGNLPVPQPAGMAIPRSICDRLGIPRGHLVACIDCAPVAQMATPITATVPPLALGISGLDANGFLTVSRRFDPTTYFRQHPRVSGLYDGDYAAFSLGGPQAAAFDRVLALSRDRQIPLVLVNLPLTDIYLDATRSRAEQQFAQTWQARASRDGFYFRDYARRWPQNHAFFDDPSHLNQWGAAAIAQLLAHDRSLPWPQVSTLKPE